MKSDEELKQTFKILVDENNIIHLTVLKYEKEPKDNGRIAELVEETILKIFNEKPQKKYSFFVDLLPVGKISPSGFSRKTREVGTRIVNSKQVKRAALISSSVFLKTVISFIITVARKGEKMKWFSDKEEALKWLKED